MTYKENETYNINGIKVFIENITKATLRSETGGEINSDELITSECSFTVEKDGKKFGVEAYHVTEDADIYSINVWDNTDTVNREFNAPNHMCWASLDSTGGGTDITDHVSLVKEDYTHYEDVEQVIEDILFGVDGIIIAF